MYQSSYREHVLISLLGCPGHIHGSTEPVLIFILFGLYQSIDYIYSLVLAMMNHIFCCIEVVAG